MKQLIEFYKTALNAGYCDTTLLQSLALVVPILIIMYFLYKWL
jgi:hypothetical protein